MLGFAWLTLRQAQEALKNGRLEEAHRLLCQQDSQGHKGSWELLEQVAQGFLNRAERHLDHDDAVAAWNDLLQAEQIGVTGDGAASLRKALTQRALGEVRAMLEAGEPVRAVEIVSQLRDRSGRNPEIQLLEETTKGWAQAREVAGRGEFGPALQTVKRVSKLLPSPIAALERYQAELEEHGKTFGGLLIQLHEAVEYGKWREVLSLAEKVLAVAPQHLEARRARARAWKSIEPLTLHSPPPVMEAVCVESTREPGRRFLLWIDGVGGYLICLGARITVGQAAPEANVEVPLFADVSRSHAALTRDSEGYLLEAFRPVQVNGQMVEKALLQPGDRITLGTSCQVQFTQPVPLSATAQLHVVSGHRLPLAIERVFLMADTLVLGPPPQSHVVMGDLQKPVVLFRNKEGLGVHYAGNLVVDGQPCRDRAILGPSSRVTGDDFAFAVEPVGPRMGKC